MRKINTIGIKQANKVMLMAGTAYNLKKYLKFIEKRAKSKTQEVKTSLTSLFEYITAKKMRFERLIYFQVYPKLTPGNGNKAQLIR